MAEPLNLKAQAAAHALTFVQSGMKLGLGSGSTNRYFVDMLGQALQQGTLRDIVGVPTSTATARQAADWGIPLADIAAVNHLDLAVDGADEVDPDLNLIKGLGKALLREKIVEIHTTDLLIIVDESKMVPRLGTKGALPVEVAQFGAAVTIRWLNTLGCRAEQWFKDDGSPYITDNSNFLARCWFDEGIADLSELALQLAARPGVVEHGLFLGMTNRVIVAAEGGIYTKDAPPTT